MRPSHPDQSGIRLVTAHATDGSQGQVPPVGIRADSPQRIRRGSMINGLKMPVAQSNL